MGLYVMFSPGLVIAQGVLFPVVCTLLGVCRFLSRRQKQVALGADDYLVIPAMILMIGMGVAELIGVSEHAMGYTSSPVSRPDQASYQEMVVVQIYWHIQWMQALTLGCVKLSFIFLYRRIFAVGLKSEKYLFNITSIALAIIIVVWSIGFFFSYLLICPGHPAAYWAEFQEVHSRYCWNTTKFVNAYVWSDPVIDVLVFILPIPSVLNLHMNMRRKLAVVAVFFMGALAVAASFIRAAFFAELLHVAHTVKHDYTVINTSGTYWTVLETGLALIAVNLPAVYGWVKIGGIDSVLRSVRSLQSLRGRKRDGAGRDGASRWRKGVHLESHGVRDEPHTDAYSGGYTDIVEPGKIKVVTEFRVHKV